MKLFVTIQLQSELLRSALGFGRAGWDSVQSVESFLKAPFFSEAKHLLVFLMRLTPSCSNHYSLMIHCIRSTFLFSAFLSAKERKLLNRNKTAPVSLLMQNFRTFKSNFQSKDKMKKNCQSEHF